MSSFHLISWNPGEHALSQGAEVLSSGVGGCQPLQEAPPPPSSHIITSSQSPGAYFMVMLLKNQEQKPWGEIGDTVRNPGKVLPPSSCSGVQCTIGAAAEGKVSREVSGRHCPPINRNGAPSFKWGTLAWGGLRALPRIPLLEESDWHGRCSAGDLGFSLCTPGHLPSSHSPCPCVPFPKKSPREKTSHSAPHR